MSILGSICLKRSMTLRFPKSGEQLDQVAPMAAQAKGLDFDALVWRILETSLERA